MKALTIYPEYCLDIYTGKKTIEQVKIADDFITKHFPSNADGSWDVDTFNAMIESCWQKADEIWHPERYY